MQINKSLLSSGAHADKQRVGALYWCVYPAAQYRSNSKVTTLEFCDRQTESHMVNDGRRLWTFAIAVAFVTAVCAANLLTPFNIGYPEKMKSIWEEYCPTDCNM